MFLLILWSSEAIIITQWAQKGPDNPKRSHKISMHHSSYRTAELTVLVQLSSSATLSELLDYHIHN